MNFRMGLILAGSLALAATGCASGGGGAGDTGSAAPSGMGGEVLREGESPRENSMTDAADDHLEQAEEADTEAEARPHFQAALEQAEQAVAADSTNPLPWYQGGIAHIGLENYAEADLWLEAATDLRPIYMLQIDPLREQTWVNVYQEVQPLLDQGDYEAAAEELLGAHQIYRERPEVMVLLGQIYSNLARYEEAVDMFRQAQAVIDSERIQEVDSVTAAGWREQAETIPAAIADLLIASGDYQAAVEQLRMLRQEDPDNLDITRNLAMVYLQMEQPDSAVPILEDLLARPDLSAQEYYQVGVGFYNLPDYENAAEAFQKAADVSPRHRDAAEMTARSIQLRISDLPEGQDPPEAEVQMLLDAAEAWLELDPYSSNAHLIAAQAANQLGDQERAQELVTIIEEMPVVMQDLQLQVMPGSGGNVRGQIINQTMEPGSTVTVVFTFYGEDGQQLGTEQTTVQLPAAEGSQTFQVSIETEEPLGGYTYDIEGI